MLKFPNESFPGDYFSGKSRSIETAGEVFGSKAIVLWKLTDYAIIVVASQNKFLTYKHFN